MTAFARHPPILPLVNQIDLQSRIAVITGGARGIGLAIAQRLTASGAACSLWDRDASALASAAAAFPASARLHTAVVDITKPDSVPHKLPDVIDLNNS